MTYYKPATPISLRTLGTTQRVLLLKAHHQGSIRAVRVAEQHAALRLHQHGLFDRGRTSGDWWITEKGRAVSNG